jgi:hypothetical protein
MTLTYTKYYRFPKTDFLSEPWQQGIWDSFDSIDALMYNNALSSNITLWQNSTPYIVGNMRIDSANGTTWLCSVPHTSAPAPSTFAQDRINNPSYWTGIQLSFRARGQWQHSTQYILGDMAFDATSGQGTYGVCSISHTSNSSGHMSDDNAYWTFIYNSLSALTASGIGYNNSTSGLTAVNVQAAIDEVNTKKASLISPALTGVPTAPTVTPSTDSTTKLATTAFVQSAILSGTGVVNSFNSRTGAVILAGSDVTGAGGALIASPTFTGTPAAPTPAPGTNTTQLATTAFVQSATGAANQNRNRIINGHFIVDQRNNFAAVTPATTTAYTADRWQLNGNPASKLTIQALPASTVFPSGIAGALAMQTASAYVAGASEIFSIQQGIEFQNMTDFNFGNAGAATITLSFWAFASVAGTYSGSLFNNGGTRSFVFTFALAASTWTRITVVVPGDVAGTWYPGSSNSRGMGLSIDLGSGSSLRTAVVASWTAGIFVGASGSVALVANAGAILQLANVQLELGSVATPFDWQSVADTLAACRRYFQDIWFILYAPAANVAGFGGAVQQITYPVCMRAAPTALATDNILSSVWTGTTTPTYVFAPDNIRVSSPTTQANAGAFLIGRTRLQAEL